MGGPGCDFPKIRAEVKGRLEFSLASSIPKSEGAIVRMHLVSYEFGPLKVLPEGDIGVNVSSHPKQDYLRKGKRVRKKEEKGEESFPREEKKGQRRQRRKTLQRLKF